MLFLIGLPSLFVEQSIGQYGRVAVNKVQYMAVLPIPRSSYQQRSISASLGKNKLENCTVASF